MRQRAEWMRPVDDQIMEYLRDAGAGTPQSIADAIGKNNQYIGVRCRKLTEYGLLERPSRGFYLLTDDGEDYLDEGLDASKLEDGEK